MNGESTHATKRDSKTVEGLRRPTQSIKPTEPTAPATTTVSATSRRKPRYPPSDLARLAFVGTSPGSSMLIAHIPAFGMMVFQFNY